MTRIGVVAAAAVAVLGVLPAAIGAAAPAHTDCGDPGEPGCAGSVPTVDEVVAVLNTMTDPTVPAAAKTDVVTPGFTPEEAQKIDEQLNWFGAHGYVPFTFVVTDVQPAPNDLAGATVSVPHPWTPPGPIVLVDQDGHWLITHDTAMTVLNALWHNSHRGGGGFGGGGSNMPPQPNVTNP